MKKNNVKIFNSCNLPSEHSRILTLRNQIFDVRPVYSRDFSIKSLEKLNVFIAARISQL